MKKSRRFSKKQTIIGFLAVVLIAGAGLVAWAVIIPLSTSTMVDEPMPEISAPQNTPESPSPIVRQTTLEGITYHKASGQAKIIGTTLRLENFTVTNGPDLYVYLGTSEKPVREVARLKANQGNQNYELPTGTDPATISTIWIYCKAFVTPFAKAVFN